MSKPPSSITPNPGGAIHPDTVLGRNEIIERYWDILEMRSMALLAPRRLGKTSVCRRMERYPHAGMVVRYRDLEGLTHPAELVRALVDDADAMIGRGVAWAVMTRSYAEKVFGTVEFKEILTVRLPELDWRALLDTVLTDIQAWAVQQDCRVVLFWDEFTLFLYDLVRQGRASDAMVLLDRLRAARQQCMRLRVVYTGSIGLAEVLHSLRERGYANDPVNDMAKEVLPLMGLAPATELAERLLAGFVTTTAPRHELAAHIARLTQGHPFLIQHVAERLRQWNKADIPAADAALEALIEAEGDPLELNHYLSRLALYLNEVQHRVALAVLDRLAVREAGLGVDDLVDATGADRELLLGLLSSLRKDLYLTRTEGRFAFRLGFLRRWWCLERAL
ncbi:MAG: hypothetical protein ABIO70_02930 [Pseudomonadota bacterium]